MGKTSFILMLSSILLGILGGIFFPNYVLNLEWIGILFINLLKLIALPLVFAALVSAITSIGDFRKLGRVGGYTLLYISFSVGIAILIGLLLINFFKPGIGINACLIPTDGAEEDKTSLGFVNFLHGLFPPNIIEAAAKFQIMPVVIFAVIFAISCLSCGEKAQPIIIFFKGLKDVFVKMMSWLMHLTPIGLFSLIGTAVAKAKTNNLLVSSLKGLSAFIAVFLLALLLQTIWQLAVVKFITKRRPLEYLSAASPALLTAFGTSSSMATLPVAILAAQKQGISSEVARFVLPFATTVNLAGTAMYEAYSALFFSQILNIPLSIWDQVGIFFIAIIAGMGATGIPEAGLITMITVLRSVNIPTSAIGLLLPVDRILDRFRTMVNVWGDLVCAAVINYFTHSKKLKIPKSESENNSFQASAKMTPRSVYD